MPITDDDLSFLRRLFTLGIAFALLAAVIMTYVQVARETYKLSFVEAAEIPAVIGTLVLLVVGYVLFGPMEKGEDQGFFSDAVR